MITTGIPVTVAIFQWLTKYAADHPTWFDKNHSDSRLINALFLNDLTTFDQHNDFAHCHDFLRWIGVWVLAFDGGILSSNIRTFSEDNDGIYMQWSNGISHRIDAVGWDRPTRNAIDYIVQRACTFRDFQNNTQAGLRAIFHFLKHYQNELAHQVSFSKGLLTNPPTDLGRDAEFLILSSVPAQPLQKFYESLAAKFPDDVCFEGLAEPLPAHMFFAQPVTADMLVIDKVKMHYNLVFHAELDSELQATLAKETSRFIASVIKDAKLWADVQAELTCVCDEQFTPRLTLFDLLFEVFQWQV